MQKIYLRKGEEMKIYRFVAKNCYQKKWHGILRGLNFEKAHIPDGEYEEVLGYLNENLNVPNSMYFRKPKKDYKGNIKQYVNIPVEFWFTEAGYQKFADSMEKLLCLYYKYSPNYIKEWDILETEISINDKRILYDDQYQLALKK